MPALVRRGIVDKALRVRATVLFDETAKCVDLGADRDTSPRGCMAAERGLQPSRPSWDRKPDGNSGRHDALRNRRLSEIMPWHSITACSPVGIGIRELLRTHFPGLRRPWEQHLSYEKQLLFDRLGNVGDGFVVQKPRRSGSSGSDAMIDLN